MIRPVLAVACALALLVPVAHAQAPYARFDDAPVAQQQDTTADAAWRSWSHRSAAALAATGQPRELAFAAVLRGLADAPPEQADTDTPSQPATPDAQASAWRRDAAARAGSDVLANALLAYSADEATRLRAAQRWLGAEPQNLAPLLMRGGGVDALLADARVATRFELGMLDQVRWMQAALLRTPPTPAERIALAEAGDFVPTEQAAITAMGLWAAVAVPGLDPLMQGCTAEMAAANATRARDCRHVADLMADASDTQLGEMLGLALLERLATTQAERAGAQDRRRAFDWRMLEWGRANAALPRDGAGQFVRFLADPSVRTEADLTARALQAAGIPLDPPAGWQPPR
ncbi:conserved exported hypothetical protein [Luteimonas sp. 9C]|uniref:hypothetical protein n=1 Tax=Luteimonas sp. 9C TaxID=2653148 RepID=UPI0012F45B72|nr:hypothetical protein [Luteimonas sp. 9C]VXB12949.1 conserved exported hypothetical protein [Luteimonas sp. 9C]